MTQPLSKRLVSEARLVDVITTASNAATAAAQSKIDSSAAAAASSATAAQNSANLVGAPADTAIATAVNAAGTQTRAALDARYPKKGDLVANILDYGAVNDGVFGLALIGEGATVTAGSKAITTPQFHGYFTNGHVGKTIGIEGAGAPVTATTTGAIASGAVTFTVSVGALPSGTSYGTATLTDGTNSQTLTVAPAAAGATTVTFLTVGFTAAFAAGSTITLPAPHITTIASVSSSTAATLTAAPARSMGAATYYAGTDNTTAIQNAINSGRPVFIPGGAFMTKQLTVATETTIFGANGSGMNAYTTSRASQLILAPGANSALIYGNAARFVNLRDLKLTGASQVQTGQAPLVQIADLTAGTGNEVHWNIDDCYISFASGDGIYLGSFNRGMMVKNTYCHYSGGNGVKLQGTDSQIAHSFFGTNVLDGLGGSGQAIIITHCNVWSNRNGIGCFGGIVWQITGNYIDSNKQSGVYLPAGHSHSIVGNTFTPQSTGKDTASPAIYLTSSVVNVDISGNIFYTPSGFAGNRVNYAVYGDAGCDWTENGNTYPAGYAAFGYFGGSATMRMGWGKAPIARPTVTGSTNGDPALSSLLTQLSNLGLVTNSSAGGSGAPIYKTASYSIVAATDSVVFMNGASLTATLPDPSTVVAGQRIVVKNLAATAVTVNSAGTSKTIDGAASVSLASNAVGRYISDGNNWFII